MNKNYNKHNCMSELRRATNENKYKKYSEFRGVYQAYY